MSSSCEPAAPQPLHSCDVNRTHYWCQCTLDQLVTAQHYYFSILRDCLWCWGNLFPFEHSHSKVWFVPFFLSACFSVQSPKHPFVEPSGLLFSCLIWLFLLSLELCQSHEYSWHCSTRFLLKTKNGSEVFNLSFWTQLVKALWTGTFISKVFLGFSGFVCLLNENSLGPKCIRLSGKPSVKIFLYIIWI